MKQPRSDSQQSRCFLICFHLFLFSLIRKGNNSFHRFCFDVQSLILFMFYILPKMYQEYYAGKQGHKAMKEYSIVK